MNKFYTIIQPGQYYQVHFSRFCGFAGFRVYEDNYEYFKTYSVMISNKYASKIEEIESYLFANNPNFTVTFEIIDGIEGDDCRYIRINNTGSKGVSLMYGVLNMI